MYQTACAIESIWWSRGRYGTIRCEARRPQHAVVVVDAHELALRVDHDVGGHREERRRSIEGVADEGRWPLAIPEEL